MHHRIDNKVLLIHLCIGVSTLVKLAESLECYSCGLGMISPEKDGFTYNIDEFDVNSKMYNESCTGFATYLVEGSKAMNKWVRPCPPNVINCFWAKGSYNDESPEFRGCADAEFLHENKCTRELQAVTVIDSVKHVDVNVELCYCDNDLCNEERNAAHVIHYAKSIPALLLLMNLIK